MDNAITPKMIVIRDIKDQAIGTEVWPASRMMLNWLGSSADAPALAGATILELGSGTGALAMSLVSQHGVSHVFASEGEADVFENLRANVSDNGMGAVVVPCLWDWKDSLFPPAEVLLDTVDVIIASDIVYVGSSECELSHALAGLCRPDVNRSTGRTAWLCLSDRPQGGERFLPPPDLDDGMDSRYDADGRVLSAVGRFLHACARRGLQVQRMNMGAELFEIETKEAGCHGERREFEGCIQMYRIWSISELGEP
eukprot:CAMPEP_0172779794 /NCGR_PEP_ID=MMETSP1074-20121228/202601_1 /TAXON_ID=2916 /ORGANISM="Ceratium fusus, Strain PA161109" /LENGTH=254 /DNA_ID=CAMNT_0013616759 /DNA_START=40 /DNA_END=804 /DNA_ORIENTATION=+